MQSVRAQHNAHGKDLFIDSSMCRRSLMSNYATQFTLKPIYINMCSRFVVVFFSLLNRVRRMNATTKQNKINNDFCALVSCAYFLCVNIFTLLSNWLEWRPGAEIFEQKKTNFFWEKQILQVRNKAN